MWIFGVGNVFICYRIFVFMRIVRFIFLRVFFCEKDLKVIIRINLGYSFGGVKVVFIREMDLRRRFLS